LVFSSYFLSLTSAWRPGMGKCHLVILLACPWRIDIIIATPARTGDKSTGAAERLAGWLGWELAHHLSHTTLTSKPKEYGGCMLCHHGALTTSLIHFFFLKRGRLAGQGVMGVLVLIGTRGVRSGRSAFVWCLLFSVLYVLFPTKTPFSLARLVLVWCGVRKTCN